MNVYVAEFVGTAILILFGTGVVANVNLKGSLAKGAGWVVIAFGWGFAVTFGIYAVGQFSGAHINPAVTLGFAFAGEFPWVDVVPFIIAQVLGAMLGAFLVWLHFMPHFKAEEDEGTKLGVYATGPVYPNYVANFASEMIGTFILILGLLFIGANDFTDGLNPLIVGFLVTAIGLSLGGTTGYAINPARDFGPRLAHFLMPIPGKGPSNFKYAPVPILGPLSGGALGAAVYNSVFLNATDIYLFIAIVFVIAVLALGVFLNKSVLKEETSKLM
ncbi:MIP/aquaporin family protein [Salinicoccus kekensis]|uniref:Glycerol uptake facilitator protein n=1 Tax=Salinicoccus kekensis TaxID=714307 RepID=A0A285UT51_9STAP|nr:MIP/aquaporin family protein [Salinicoccus kekensis]SOC44989.1 glycerol uptake facilitator protein [Salinicoccus kekensis]